MIQIKNLNISFKQEQIFKDFSLQLAKGGKLAITGESGKGKSTLLNLLAGFISDFKGEVIIDNKLLSTDNIDEIRKSIAWLPQDISFKISTVNELLFVPFDFAQNKKLRPSMDKVKEILETFGLPQDILKKKVKEISGGQKQRIILASLLLMDKALILLDEPTSALDKRIKKKVSDYILSQKHLTVIAATHDQEWVNQSDQILHLH